MISRERQQQQMFGFGKLLNDTNNKPVGAVFGECQHSKKGFSYNAQPNDQCITISLRSDGKRSWLAFHPTNLFTSEANECLSSTPHSWYNDHNPIQVEAHASSHAHFSGQIQMYILAYSRFSFSLCWRTHAVFLIYSSLIVLSCCCSRFFCFKSRCFCTFFPFSLFQDFKSHCLVIYMKANCEQIHNHPKWGTIVWCIIYA